MPYKQIIPKAKEQKTPYSEPPKDRGRYYYSLSDKKEYNGWSNYNTWKVALNLSNDQSTQEYYQDAIKEGQITDGDSYKDWFKENFESKEEGYYKLYDGWSEAEIDGDVDWDEIYKSHSEEVKDLKEYEKKKLKEKN